MSGILLGLGQLAQPMALLALLGGVVIGLIVGSLPGLNDSITMAVLIPITFGMEPCVAICLLIGIYCASACGRLCTVYSVKDSGNCIRYCNSL